MRYVHLPFINSLVNLSTSLRLQNEIKVQTHRKQRCVTTILRKVKRDKEMSEDMPPAHCLLHCMSHVTDILVECCFVELRRHSISFFNK